MEPAAIKWRGDAADLAKDQPNGLSASSDR